MCSERALRLVALVACAASACDQCLPEDHEYRGLRVLGVAQTPWSPAADEPVRLRAVTLDVAERPVQVAWYACHAPWRRVGFADPKYSVAATLAVDERACVASGEIGRGEEITVTPPRDEGAEVLLDARPDAPSLGRWVAYLGVACAGALTAPEPGAFLPGCTVGVSAPFVTRVRVLDAPSVMSPPPRIDAIEVERDGVFVDASTVTVPPCVGARTSCAAVRIRVRHTPDVDVTDQRTSLLNDDSIESWVRPRMSFFVSASAPAVADEGCTFTDPRGEISADATFGWVPPASPQDVTLAVTLRDVLGGFAWSRVTVRVR